MDMPDFDPDDEDRDVVNSVEADPDEDDDESPGTCDEMFQWDLDDEDADFFGEDDDEDDPT